MKTLFTIVSIFLAANTSGQVFPIQVVPQLVPPYSPYLSDYTGPGAQNLIVQIHANDVSISNYPCKLRITIEGVGITITTKSAAVTRPLMLQGGIPQIFYGEDLIDYFHPGALDFYGISRREYETTGRLPEGVYRFRVEVLDYNRGTVVSNTGVAMAWIILNDPPILNLPSHLSRVKIQGPTNILFTWTPRHSGSPNAAFTTENTFRLIEIWPDNRNPNDALLTQLPLFEATTAQNQVLYGMTEPALIPGRKYAWQVQSKDAGGKDLFRNEGRSEVFVFQYGAALAVPDNLQLRWAKPTTLSVRWDPVFVEGEDVRYRLQYRTRLRREDHQWYETSTQFTERTLYHLQSNTDYEMRIRTELATQESEYSAIRVFKTLPPQKDGFVCADPVTPPPPPAITLPVFPLSTNDTLHAGGYDILVRDVMEVEGKYHGSGMAIVPWLNAAKVRVTFENIRVNDRFWLTSGVIKSVWNPESGFLMEEQTPILPGSAPQAGELDITILAADTLITIEGMAIAAVTKDDAGNVVVTTTDGKQQTLAMGETYAIVDEVGNGYVIDAQGNIAKTTASEAKAVAGRGARQYSLALRFERGDGEYGFDEKTYDGLAHYYQQLQDGSHVPWKALSTAQPDNIEARLVSDELDIQQVTFEVSSTPVTSLSSSEGSAKLTLSGKMAGLEEELLALHRVSDTLPAKVIGKLNLATYAPVHYNLEIVPVNGASLPGGLDVSAISKGLNSIYNEAVVAWRVSMEKNIQVDLPATFDDGETGVFSNYTEDMQTVLKAYGRLDDNTYYLFIIGEPRNPASLGYMPRNRQAGFLFAGPHGGNAEEFLKTIAHELGHGAFNLKHTFSEHNLALGTTDNVMDYGPGTALFKYQWDYIHDPQSVVGLFEGDEVGESVVVRNMAQLKEFANPDGSYTFLAPTGTPFTLPAETQSIQFWTNDSYADGVIEVDEAPDGALISFTLENETYRYHKVSGENRGSGYKIQKGGLPFIDVLSKMQRNIQHAVIGLPCVQGGELKFIAQQVVFTSSFPKKNHSAEGQIADRLPTENPYGLDYTTKKIFLHAELDFTYTDEAKDFIDDNEACMNEMAPYIIKAADVIQKYPGYYTLYKACSPYPMAYPKGGEVASEKAWLLGQYYERLKGFADELLTYITTSQYARANVLSLHEPDVLGDLLKNTCEPDFALFSLEERKHIISVLSSGNLHDFWLGLGNNRENIVIYTIGQTPEDQHAGMLELLEKDGYALLKKLIIKCDNQLIGRDNFDKLIDAVTFMIQKTYAYERFDLDIQDDKILRWGSNGYFQNFVYECPDWASLSGAGTITFTYHSYSPYFTPDGQLPSTAALNQKIEYHTLEAAPFDYVVVRLYQDSELQNGLPLLKRNAGEFQAVPALYLYWMIHRKATDETLAHIKANVNLLLFVIGGAEIVAARTGLRLALAITDQALFATSFVLEAGPRKLLEEGPNGKEWTSVFKTFDAFNLLYGAARIGQGLSLAATDLISNRALLRQLKGAEDWKRFSPAQEVATKEAIENMEKRMDELEGMVGVNTAVTKTDDLLDILARLSPELQERIRLMPKQQMDDLLADINSSPDLMEQMSSEMVDGWEVLAAYSILRKRPENLEILGHWVTEGVGKEALRGGLERSRSRQKLIDLIKEEAVNRLHVHILIKDYDNIPGVVPGRYVPNGSKLSDKSNPPNNWRKEYDLEQRGIVSFTGRIEPVELKPGTTIYRVSDAGGGAGKYWTMERPQKLEDVIGGTAVQPRWNDFQYIYEYHVPEGITIKCWSGKVARQKVDRDVSNINYHLPGGYDQLFIKDIALQDLSFNDRVIKHKVQW